MGAGGTMRKPGQRQSTRVGRFPILLQAARKGSEEALGQLLDAYRPFLLSVATSHFDSDLKAKAGPSDVVQETFVDAYKDFASFKSSTDEELRIWLHTLLMNNLADLRKRYLKSASRQVKRERPIATSESKEFARQIIDHDGHTPNTEAVSKEMAARVEAALQELPPAYRMVIVMRNHDRRSFSEIGKAMNKSADAARMFWKRAVLRLRQQLGELDDNRRAT